MAQIKRPLYDDGPVNAGEKRLLDFLELKLPDDYVIIPNLNIAIMGDKQVMKYWEYDCIVVAPHAVYHIENKDWGGHVEGDDWAWSRSGQEVVNPHKSAGFKSRILASKIKNEHPDWQFDLILTAVTLSNPRQSKFGIDPRSVCYNQTFTLGEELVEFLTNPDRVCRRQGQIKSLQSQLVDFLTGQSVADKRAARTTIFNFHIEEKIQETEEFTEYLCTPQLVASAHYKIREYPLDNGKSPEELKNFQHQVQNAYMAQEKIGDSPYIVKPEFRMNEEQTYYYEISRYQDECTLRAKLKRETFKQTDKIKILLDIAYALKAAHKVGVFHRDVRPENVYLYEDRKAALANFRMAWFVEHTNLDFTINQKSDEKSPYMAPELLQEDATSGSDVFSWGVVFYELMTNQLPFDSVSTFMKLGGVLPEDHLPSRIVKDLPVWVDEVARRTIVADLDKRCQDISEIIEFIEKETSNHRQENTENSQTLSLKDLKPGMKVTSSMTLHELLGKGGFGRVFKVWHDISREYFAIKIFERDASVENAINEYEALKSLHHPNIVKFIFTDRTTHNMFYTLMELLEGDNLQEYTRGDLRLPTNEIYKMASEIVDALVYMQEQENPICHRDIKPSNIIWHKREVYKLIDFNISTPTEDKSYGGTFAYIAPDLVLSSSKIDWDQSADTFALGITLYQLLTHAYPWPGSAMRPNINEEPTDVRKYNDKLTDDFADFVMKAIATDRNKRFRTAKVMQDALLSIGRDGMLKETQCKTTSTLVNAELDPVDYINSLYSQSRHGNGGTRAGAKSHALDKLTYSETKLDKVLIKDIKDLKYKLVIITGNAGDGKTAFIHRIESQGTNKVACKTNNGSQFYFNGVRFESNYDGSQDEAEKANNDVLVDFLKPFYGLDDYMKAKEGRVIAINEGRLVDFLSTQPQLRKLQDNIEDYFYQEGHTELLPGLMVINLNLRSVTAHDGDTPSLLAQQVKKLTSPELWSKCGGCPIADRCYIKYNVDTFQDSSAGDEVINRLERLLRIIVYKRELHITMRDLRSMIAWMLTRDYSCEEVKQLVEYVKTAPAYYWQYYYFNLTSPFVRKPVDFTLPTLESNDRLIKLLRETDVAGVALPSLDRDLYYTSKQPNNYLIFSNRGQGILKDFNDNNVMKPSYEMKNSDERLESVFIHKTFIRHQYFEGMIDFRRRLPYRFASKFEEQLQNEDEESLQSTKQDLACAISASEGCVNSDLTKGYLLLSSSNEQDPISKSYRRFSLDEFELMVNKTDHLTKYIEYESDSLTFRHKTDKFIRLTVSLDLYEMLKYIRAGFSPSVNDLRGRFIELQIFKNLLESKTYSEILVTKNNRKFTVIRLDSNKHIVIEPLKA